MNIKQITKTTSLGLLAGLPFHANAQDNRPNIIVILADDLGYSDIGCYGGEIETPNLDRLAENGLRFSRFYNTSRSCPTRASLLSGLYQHQAGMGRMTNTHSSLPAYKGELSRNAVTIAEVLKTAGYQTGMLGKWHQSETFNKSDQTTWASHRVYYPDFANRASYPVNRGFDDFYGIIWGAANYFDPFSLVNGEEPVRDVPKDYYFTQALSDSAVSYVNRYSEKAAPFFLYLAYNAPHWPLHALPEDIAKYEEKYKVGWDVIRNERYQRILDKKIFGDRTNFLTAKNPTKLWTDNTTKDWDARAMAVYAAMIDRMDQGIGQLIDALEKNGQLENTLILFMSDNGCANEQPHTGGPGDAKPATTRDGTPVIYPANKEVMPGPETVFSGLPGPWTNASNTPFRLWKSKSAEGGICTPMIAFWPKGIKTNVGKVTEQMGHVMDIMATCIDLSGATYPEVYNGNTITPLEGISLAPVFDTGERIGHKEICFEHFDEKALITDDLWKLVQASGNNAAWELYNLNTDRTEMKNVAGTYPDKVAELRAAYDAWVVRCNVKPAPGDPADKNPVAISEAEDLELVRDNMGGNYYLTEDITIPEGVNWLPLGKSENWNGTPANLTNFTGIFDGRGFSVKNLTITGDGSTFYDFSGLFARVAGGGDSGGSIVKNLNLENVNITGGGGQTGGLSGTMFGDPGQLLGATIENISVTGTVEGKTEVGGLVGRCNNASANKVTDCYVNANVKATGASGAYAGGIVGCMNSGQNLTIKNVYAAGSVTATNYAGGILGYVNNNNTATTFTLQASAVVLDEISAATKGLFYNNGLLAVNKISSVNNHARNDIPGVTGGTDAPAVFGTQDFYATTLNWDFNKIWAMEAGKEYPVLKYTGPTSINEQKPDLDFQVYPVRGGIFVNAEKPVAVSVFNIRGQKIYAGNNIRSSIYIPLQQGVYLVKVKKDNKESTQKTIVL